jgi:hypothetical protein
MGGFRNTEEPNNAVTEGAKMKQRPKRNVQGIWDKTWRECFYTKKVTWKNTFLKRLMSWQSTAERSRHNTADFYLSIHRQPRHRWKDNIIRRLVAGFPPRRPGFTPGSGHGFCDGQKWRWGTFSQRTSVSPANLHSICFSTIIFTFTRAWHNRPVVAAVPIESQTK